MLQLGVGCGGNLCLVAVRLPGLCATCTHPHCSGYATHAATCGAVKQDTDLTGADLPSGIVENIVSPDACCTACIARQECGAWTFVSMSELCYLKAVSGWQERAVQGLQSSVMSNRNTTVVIMDPDPPASPPPPSPSPPPTTPGAPPSPSPGDPYAPGPYQFVEMTQDQKRRMYELTSIFENADVGVGWEWDCSGSGTAWPDSLPRSGLCCQLACYHSLP